MSLPRPDLSGGPSTHLPLLRAGLEAAGVRIIPFNYTRRKDNETSLEKIYGRSIDLLRLVYLILRCRPDLVHHNSAFDLGSLVRDGMLCAAARLLRTPVFIKIHGSHRTAFGRLAIFKRATRHLILNLSVDLGVLSAAEKEEFVVHWPQLRDRIHVVKNIIRQNFIQAEVKDHGKLMVFFTSRFVKEKGMFDLLDATPAILSAYPHCRFSFIGGGPDVAAFTQKVEEMGLNHSITYLSNRSFLELIEIYREGGIFVFPSHFPEGMPMALVEAMAVGLLAISSAVRFVRDVPSFTQNPMLLLNEANGLSNQIALSVANFLGNPGLRKKVGEMNKSFVAQYSQQAVALDFMTLYGKLIGRS